MMDSGTETDQDIKAAKCILRFKSVVKDIPLPEKFTFPFSYDPHPLAIIAAEELQNYISNQPALLHDFGISDENNGLGKMFGVLVVKDKDNNPGYLAAFSGKLMGGNHFEGFVPPVYDTLDVNGFYKKEESETHQINLRIEELEKAPAYLGCLDLMKQKNMEYHASLFALKQEIKTAKLQRLIKRNEGQSTLSDKDFDQLNEKLNQESIVYHYRLKDMIKYWKCRLEGIRDQLNIFENEIRALKEIRRNRSVTLQKKIV